LAARAPEARAAIPAGRRGVDLAEGFEQAALPVLGDADAAIPDGEVKPVPPTDLFLARLERLPVHREDHFASASELDRVVQQFDQDLPKAGGVAHDGARKPLIELVC